LTDAPAGVAPPAGDAELSLVGEALDWSGVPVDSGVKNMGVEDDEFESEDIIAGTGDHISVTLYLPQRPISRSINLLLTVGRAKPLYVSAWLWLVPYRLSSMVDSERVTRAIQKPSLNLPALPLHSSPGYPLLFNSVRELEVKLPLDLRRDIVGGVDHTFVTPPGGIRGRPALRFLKISNAAL